MKMFRYLLAALLLVSPYAWSQDNPTVAISEDSLSFYTGATPTTVHATFANYIITNMTDVVQRHHIVTRLSPYEMYRIRTLYQQEVGNTTALDALINQSGTYYAAQWFAANANSPTSSNYSGQKVVPRIKMLGGPSVLLDYTIEEIYLYFRTMPYGSLSAAAAAWETASVVSANVLLAYGAGYTVGTEISQLIEMYDPALNDAIGGTIAEIIDNLRATANMSQTALKTAIRNYFGPTRVGPPAPGDIRAMMSSMSNFYFGYGNTTGTVTVSGGFWPSYGDAGGGTGQGSGH